MTNALQLKSSDLALIFESLNTEIHIRHKNTMCLHLTITHTIFDEKQVTQ